MTSALYTCLSDSSITAVTPLGLVSHDKLMVNLEPETIGNIVGAMPEHLRSMFRS